MRIRLLVGLATAFVVSIGVVVLMLLIGDVRPNTLQFEFAKILLQVGLVSAVGAALSLLTYEYQQDREKADKSLDEARRRAEKDRDEEQRKAEKAADEERRQAEKARDEERRRHEYRQELLIATLGRVTASYTEVKRTRRLLRGLAMTAEATGQPVAIIASHYDEQIAAINDAQLEFENLAHDVRTSAAAFTSASVVAQELDAIEDYLSDLISEYEEARPRFVGQPRQLSLDRLPRLEEFLASPKRGEQQKFEQGFQRPKLSFGRVQDLIRQDLLA